MNLLADTDFLIELYRNKKNAINKLKKLIEIDSQLSTTTINAAEMYLGAFKSVNTTNSLYRVNQLLSGFDLIDFTLEHALTYGELVARLKGKEIGALDSMIAAVALATGKMVLTRNIKHFDRTGVDIETWGIENICPPNLIPNNSIEVIIVKFDSETILRIAEFIRKVVTFIVR